MLGVTTSAKGNRCSTRGDRIVVDEGRSACRHHNRIDDDMTSFATLKGAGDGAHDLRRRDHADLHRVGPDVFEHRVDLRDDESGVDVEHPRNAERVLSRQRRDRAGGEKPMRLDGLDVGLNAGSPLESNLRW